MVHNRLTGNSKMKSFYDQLIGFIFLIIYRKIAVLAVLTALFANIGY